MGRIRCGGPSPNPGARLLLMDAFRGGWPVDNFPRDVCNRGGPSQLTAIESPAMATIPQRIASTFTILFGQHGDVTQLARDRDRSRQALYREAEQVLDVGSFSWTPSEGGCP